MVQRKLGIIAIVTVILAACGYQFSGSGELPEGVQTIYISVFENRTGEVGLENSLTNEVVNEFVLKRKNALVEKGSAESVLHGTIVSIRDETISRSGANNPLERRVVLTVSLVLKDRDGQILWAARQVSSNEDYDVSNDRQVTDENRLDALDDLFERLAETIYNRLTEDF
ncbi:MAG: LPS assembly lipoprotein LptE [Desulfobacterales bacterium]